MISWEGELGLVWRVILRIVKKKYSGTEFGIETIMEVRV